MAPVLLLPLNQAPARLRGLIIINPVLAAAIAEPLVEAPSPSADNDSGGDSGSSSRAEPACHAAVPTAVTVHLIMRMKAAEPCTSEELNVVGGGGS